MRLTLLLPALAVAAISCAFLPQKKGGAASPYGDFNAATPRDLPDALAEISAMLYDPVGNAIYVVTDEQGILFRLPLAPGGRLESRSFYGRGDFEGLARVGNTFYALVSNGDLVEFPAGTGDVEGMKYTASFDGKTEFESLYYDALAKKLILLCKQCGEDKKTTISAHVFDPVTKQYSSKPLRFNTKDVGKLSKGKDEALHPSDAALHPITGDLYIVASMNNLLVIADARTGAVKHSYELDKKLFKQPEGICFTPRGDLMISNEAGGKGAATLLTFPYKMPRP